MPFDFGQKDPEKKSRRRPPPNYLSRRVQWRVFMLVACFMLVIILMQEARKPDNWRWLWAFQDDGTTPAGQAAGGDVDTRLRTPSGPERNTLGPGEVLIQGAPFDDRDRPSEPQTTPPLEADLQHLTPVERARQDAWTRFLGAAGQQDRQQFLRGLKAARDEVELTAQAKQAWPAIVDQFDSQWQDYLDKAFLAVSQDEGRLTDAEKRDWLDVVEALQVQWKQQVEPALRTLGQDDQPTDDRHREAIAELQSVLDRVFLLQVRDNTVFRPDEKDAWFRLLEKLQTHDLPELERASVGPVGFLQLYRQPTDYRGRLVTVRGTVRQGYYRQAPDNFYGIDGYYIFWLKPSSANSPIAVYCLRVPDGFPDVIAMEARGEERPELNEEAEFTGFFFKRRAYRAKDGTRLTPVLLAKTPRWKPPLETASQSARLPGPLFWVLVISGSGVFGIGLACAIYWMSRTSSPRRMPSVAHNAMRSHEDIQLPSEAEVD